MVEQESTEMTYLASSINHEIGCLLPSNILSIYLLPKRTIDGRNDFFPRQKIQIIQSYNSRFNTKQGML